MRGETTSEPAGELVLCALYLAPSPAREERLRRAAAALDDWEGALAALEAHGVLGLAARNLERGGATVPPGARERLAARARVMQAIELAFRDLLERYLGAAQRAGVEVTLLKGASLALDLYPPGGLRTQADLDLLVAAEALPAALAAARAIGLAAPPGAFPAWWYRLAHFHQKLVPVAGGPGELELHWHLHAPAHLYTVRLDELRARRRPVAVGALRAFTLDPLDRLLHLATHLVRHGPLAGSERATLRAWAAEPRASLRLKWLLDLLAEVELRHATFDAELLAARAREWNAEGELAEALDGLEPLEPSPEARAWIGRVRPRLAVARRAARAAADAKRELPLAGLDLRPSALRALGRWIWPPPERFERLSPSRLPRGFRRGLHAAQVLGRASLVATLTPVAWLARSGRGRAAASPAPDCAPARIARQRELERGAQAAGADARDGDR